MMLWGGEGRGALPAMGGKMMARMPRRMSLVQHIVVEVWIMVLVLLLWALVRNDTPDLERLRDHANVNDLEGCLEVRMRQEAKLRLAVPANHSSEITCYFTRLLPRALDRIRGMQQ